MEYVLSDRKLLPYGMMNFEDIRLDNYYYVDKTSFIPLIILSDVDSLNRYTDETHKEGYLRAFFNKINPVPTPASSVVSSLVSAP